MTTTNTTETTIKATYVLNPEKGQIKILVTNKKEVNNAEKQVAAFAKNTRYSIYNNGGGYTGL
jgi:hypothetical protein